MRNQPKYLYKRTMNEPYRVPMAGFGNTEYPNNSLMYSGPTNVRGNYEVIGRAAPPQSGCLTRGCFNPDPSWAVPDWAGGPDGVDGFGAAPTPVPAPGNYQYRARVFPGFGATTDLQNVALALSDVFFKMLNVEIGMKLTGNAAQSYKAFVPSLKSGVQAGFTKLMDLAPAEAANAAQLKTFLKKQAKSLDVCIGPKDKTSQQIIGALTSAATGQQSANLCLFTAAAAAGVNINTVLDKVVDQAWGTIGAAISAANAAHKAALNRMNTYPPPGYSSGACGAGMMPVPAGVMPPYTQGAGLPFFKCFSPPRPTKISVSGNMLKQLMPVETKTFTTMRLIDHSAQDETTDETTDESTGDKAISASNKALPYLLAGGTALALGVGLYLLRRKK